MNRIAKVLSQISDDMLMHYGVARRSGRYPWGSGDNPYQHSGDFLSRVQSLKKSGMSETDIAKTMGLTTTQLRTQMSLAKDERRAVQVATAKDLREKGYSLNEIADKMGFANDSSVRSLLNENSEARMNQAKATADVLRKLIDEKGMIDVGTQSVLDGSWCRSQQSARMRSCGSGGWSVHKHRLCPSIAGRTVPHAAIRS